MTRRLLAAVAGFFALAAALPPPALAHEMTIAEIELREVARGDFIWQWTATNRSLGEAPTPLWPDGCEPQDNLLRCGEAGLQGTLAMEGVGKRYSAAIVKVAWMDGGTRVYTLTSAQPSVALHGAADDQRGIGEIAWAYGVLGVEHILAGVDHLLFVIGLLFLVGFNKRLVATISAFTVAHSLTLASSALGWLTLRPPPVEATIAISIVLVAAEALHRRPTLSRTWPALVAFLFGLVHGLGFAGALEQIGLPQNHLVVALLTFNVGVELGQLLVVGAALALARLLARWGTFARARTAALYGIGSIAAFWSIGRIAAIVA